jgi:glycosyltransferase involved in cell wall biosynthesis
VRFVGAGFEWVARQRLTDQAGARPYITWLGDIDDRRQVVAEYKRCHVFTHPSIQDAFANVCLESMASARPLVVADAASMPDMVRAAGSGLIVPPEDPEALAEALIALLGDAARRQEMSTNGRQYAQTMTWQRTAQQFIDLVQN